MSSRLSIGYVLEAGVPDLRASRPSGPATHVRHVVTELQRLGHLVRVVAQFDGATWASDPRASSALDLRPLRSRTPARVERGLRRVQASLRLPYFSYFDSRRFARAAAAELAGCDLVYERMGWMGLGGRLTAKALGVPHVLEVNGDLLPELQMNGFALGGCQRRVSLRLMRRVVRDAAQSVATGAGWGARHVAQWGIDASRVSVVQNGSALVDLLERPQLRCFRETPSVGPLRVGFVGAFDPWQGLPALVKAAGRALGTGVDLTLTLAGAGREEAALREMAAIEPLAGRVRFAGHLDANELAACLADSDVGACLYMGRAEYTGMKLLDYKAAGLAVVASGEGGEPSSVRHEETGLIVPPGDEDAVVAAFARLARDRAWTRQLGRRAREDAERRHRWRHTALALEHLLLELTGRRGGEDAPATARPDIPGARRIADADKLPVANRDRR